MLRKYNVIRDIDISDGPGVRVSIYTQGCFHCCEKCFNEETWSFHSGKVWDEDTNANILNLLSLNRTSGLSILGGDPLAPYDERYKYKDDSSDMLLELVRQSKKLFPTKTIWLWTGYLYEDFFKNDEFSNHMSKILPYIDVIVDGRYEDSLKDYRLKYCGSKNQRVIDVQKSITNNEIILYNE